MTATVEPEVVRSNPTWDETFPTAENVTSTKRPYLRVYYEYP